MKVLWLPIDYKTEGNYLKAKYAFFINLKTKTSGKV